jgi:hypothetical protein
MGDYKKLEDSHEEHGKPAQKLSPEVEAEVQTGPEGLTSSEAQRRLARDG